MKYLRVLHVITDLDNGGAEAVLYSLINNDKSNLVHHAVVVLQTDGVYAERLRRRGIEVVSLNISGGISLVRGFFLLGKTIRIQRPHVVQTWLYHADLVGGIVAWLCGCRRIFWGIHNIDLNPTRTTQLTRLVIRVNGLLSHWLPRKVVTVSEETIAPHVRHGYSARRMVVVNNGYDVRKFKPDTSERTAFRREIGVSRYELLFGMVARWGDQKDHLNLLKALALAKDQLPARWKCVLVGPGVDLQNDKLVATLGSLKVIEHVYLLGGRSDVPRVMNGLDFHVLSSRGESFSNVVAEAMACGVPVVATDVGPIARIVDDTGWIVPPGKPMAMAAALLAAARAVTDDARWKARKSASRSRITSLFSVERMVSGYRRVWLGQIPISGLRAQVS